MAKKADFTYEMFQNKLTDDDLEYDYEKHQPYFEFRVSDDKVLIGMDQIIECLALAEHLGEIPELGICFWQSVREKFNVKFEDYDIKSPYEE